MSWLLAPTALHLADDRESFGLLVGVDEEEGYIAFKTDEFANAERVVISDAFAPHWEVDGKSLNLAGYRYGGEKVWEAIGGGYIFTSVTLGVQIYMRYLREPYLRPLLEGEKETDTFGDKWWLVPQVMPARGVKTTFVAQGKARPEAGGEGDLTGSIEWNIWEPYEIPNVTGGDDDWCGVFFNEDDGTYKSIGVPTFKVYSGPGDFANEVFMRSVRAVGGKPAYRGGNGHMIRWNSGRGKFVAGEVAPGKVWFECDDLPTVPTSGYHGWYWSDAFMLAAMHFDPNTGKAVQAPDVSDLALRFERYAFGVDREEIYVGEVEEWR